MPRLLPFWVRDRAVYLLENGETEAALAILWGKHDDFFAHPLRQNRDDLAHFEAALFNATHDENGLPLTDTELDATEVKKLEYEYHRLRQQLIKKLMNLEVNSVDARSKWLPE